MAYERELRLKDYAVLALRHAYTRFMADDLREFERGLLEASRAAHAIAVCGLSEDNPRFLWVGKLSCELRLVESLRVLRDPRRIVQKYEACLFPPRVASWVVGPEDPYLPPSRDDVFAFYGVPLERADALADDLERAVRLYGMLTDGGGAGLDTLYRAEIAMRRGFVREAELLAQKALAACAPWLKPQVLDALHRAQTKLTA